MSSKHPGGRPAAYTNPEEMQILIDKYFEDIKGTILEDKEGQPILNKWGDPVIVGERPATITGLALALGFNSRTSLLNYQDKPEFMNTIIRAKARVEEYAEGKLFDKGASNGAKFSLSNNFKGWSEKSETVNKNLNANVELDSLEAAEEYLRSQGIDPDKI